MLGGYGCWTGDRLYSRSWVQRSYSNLPPHSIVYLTIRLFIIDSWDADDYFQIYIGSSYYYVYNFPWAGSDVCGNSWADRGPMTILIKEVHSASSITLTIYNRADEGSTNEAIGIRDVSITFKNNSGSEGNSFYIQDSQSYPGSGIFSGSIGCSTSQYYNGAACTSCHTSCYSCWGPDTTNCYRCKDGYFYTSGFCRPCDLSCRTCSDSTSTSCTSCYGSNYLYQDGSCRSTCYAGMSWSGGPPYYCSCVGGTYFQADSTCNSCPAPFSVSGGICIGPCASGEYYKVLCKWLLPDVMLWVGFQFKNRPRLIIL
jgi:hypothetical protein